MQRISVFDMLKIGVGPSSSHTMGPWRAAERFLRKLDAAGHLQSVTSITVDLYGSLAKTGKGHGTGMAIMMGLMGEDPITCDTSQITRRTADIRRDKKLLFNGNRMIDFDPAQHIIFHYDRSLPYHPNGLSFSAETNDGHTINATYYSVGGGFVVTENEPDDTDTLRAQVPYPTDNANDIISHCKDENMSIWQMVWENERAWRDDDAIHAGLKRIWYTMLDCIYRGCYATETELPGGLAVRRRAPSMYRKLTHGVTYDHRDEWLHGMRTHTYGFDEMVRWVNCFALAVNEENASFGRVVTAPTNGAAGVLPAVLMFYVCFYSASDEQILRFLLVAGEVGSLFKKKATISAAMGGCQAEIGVSSAMAAAALTEGLGGNPEQALMAAEIAMEHHLGLTCDPIGGLVQIPCIERNAMGAMKAITATQLALDSSPKDAKVTLDMVIETMWNTAQDMSERYKETSEAGLAMQIPVNVIEC